MKKVLFLIDTVQTGGAEKSLSLIAEYFTEYEPVFVQIYVGSNRRPSAITNSNIRVIYLNIEGKYNFGEAVKALVPVYEREKPDVVHSTLFKADIISRRLKKKYPGIPLINSFVNNSYGKIRYKNLPLKQKATLKLVELYDRYTAKSVDFFISNSQAIKETNTKALHIDPNEVKVIFRGREIPENDFSEDVLQNLKRELQVENKTVLINVGRQMERKGQFDLIESLPKVFKKNPNCVLILAGEGPIRPMLEKRTKELGLEKSILILGHRKDVLELLAISNIFVFPSYYEGLPGALLEAMIAGKLIVCSDIPENKECTNQESALFFEVGNREALSNQLDYAIKYEENLQHLKEQAKEQAKQKFDVKQIAVKYEEVYNNLKDTFSS
ncbi:glycosyltransferase family 4 protein [Zunongwangia sp. H14]|uniref:glycosyltransferase family 4 protein n=1 Tax=Zunongwangia sp. H14 TaxID=3240792 RepID=UPI003569E830